MKDEERRDAAQNFGWVLGKLTKEAVTYGTIAGASATTLKFGRLFPEGCILAAISVGGIVGTVIGANSVGARLRDKASLAENTSNTFDR